MSIKSADQIKAEMLKESLDTCAVFNPAEQDFVVHNDRSRPTHTKWIIPGVNKDVGKGKGIQHVPRYIAERYIDKMVDRMIQDISAQKWNEQKEKYREDERSKYEEKYAIRINNPKLREELTRKLWRGVVERYGGDEILEPEVNKPQPSTRTDVRSYLKELGINDQLIDDAQDAQFIDTKEGLIGQLG